MVHFNKGIPCVLAREKEHPDTCLGCLASLPSVPKAASFAPLDGKCNFWHAQVDRQSKKAHTQKGMCFFGDPPEIRTPDPLLKRQSPDSQGWGEPKTCCCSSTFRSSVFCVYVTRPTAYPVFYYNQKTAFVKLFYL